MSDRQGFTLVEIIVVVIIIGVLASVAMPSYSIQIEKTRAAEGVQSLTALLAAQKRYQLENGAYEAGPTLTLLDVDITASNNFLAPTISNAAGAVASIVRNSATIPYTLSISDTGVVACACGACAPANMCTRIGY
jgi:prepilin-type N-terminal cleavage/methylation domain-containing protein